ncbi:MAG: hypothetical protein ACTS5A_04000, partial [Candidatus Hodgkinia cicadicola]
TFCLSTKRKTLNPLCSNTPSINMKQSGFCKTLSKLVKHNRKDELFPGKLISGYITFSNVTSLR